MTDNWLGGAYGSSGILGTKSGGPIASSWAVMHHLGDDGYLRLTSSARQSTLTIAAHIDAHPQLALRAHPESTLVSFGTAHPETLDVFAIADALYSFGWYVDRQGPPPSIHLTVNAVHENLVQEFLHDLDRAIDTAGDTKGTASAYATTE
jgi:glutamate/tyrosine decarboxylase-like PLP-dependent enzyme